MTRHFVVYPSADPVRGMICARAWMSAGYRALVGLDSGTESLVTNIGVEIVVLPNPFPGYYRTINGLVAYAYKLCAADLVTCIGDDMLPPKQGASKIADIYFSLYPDGLGILQGTGDPLGMDEHGVCAAARVCGSPTFGRDWWARAYGGSGPFHEGYRSFFGDEDMWNVAKRASLLTLEPAIAIEHLHWSYGKAKRQDYHERAQGNWEADRALFFERQAQGFPRSGLLEVTA